MNPVSLSRSQLLRYGILAAPVAFAGFPLYVLAPDFYSTQFGVSLSILGLVLLCLRVFDAIQDPFIGFMSDRYSSAVFPVMMLSAMLLVGSVFALFNPIGFYPIAWFSGCMLVAVTAYSMLSINLNALGALWTNDTQQQTRISGAREAFGLVGLLLAVTMPSVLGRYVSFEKIYIWFSVILGVLMLCAISAFWRWFSLQKPVGRQGGMQKNIGEVLRGLSADTYRLYGVYGLNVLASSIPAVLLIFFIRDRLNAESYMGLFLILYFLSGAFSMPLWKKLSTIFGQYKSWMISILLAVTSFIWAFFLDSGDIFQYAVICIASGTALGGDLLLPAAILSDHVHETHSHASAATQFSIFALLSKVGLALASAITFPLLDLAGFVPGAINQASALFQLSMAYALIPCLIKLISAYLLYCFFIRKKRKGNHEKFLENISHRSLNHA